MLVDDIWFYVYINQYQLDHHTMRSKPFWPPEKIKALRDRLFVTRDGEEVPMNQAEFGRILGGYIQPTISGWENNGCTSRRGCFDLQRLSDKLDREEADAE